MTTQRNIDYPTELGELISQAALVHQHGEEAKIMRATLRELAIEAVIEKKIPIARVAAIADVHRKTLTIWVQVRQAEMRGAQRGE